MAEEQGTAVADPPETVEAQSDVAGTPESAAGREPEPTGAEAGQSESGEGEGTQPDPRAAFFEGMPPDEFDHWLKTAPPELRESSAVLKEIAGKAEQRGRTTTEEALRQSQTQADLYDDLIKLGGDARNWLTNANAYVKERRTALRQAVSEDDGEKAAAIQSEIDAVLDSEDFASATDAVATASELKTAKQHTLSLRTALSKYTPLIGEMTAEEQTLFDEARTHDAKNGTAMAQGLLLDLIVGKAVLKGRELERAEIDKDSAANEKLLQRFEVFQKAKGGIAPPVQGAAQLSAGDKTLRNERIAYGVDSAGGKVSDADRESFARDYPG